MRNEVGLWWKQANMDFDNAKKNMDIKAYYLVVFLCQQAVEKALKAYYFHVKKTGPGQTHSLIFLASEVKLPDRFMKFLRKLTPQFVNTRYPDAAYGSPSELYDQEIAQEYVKETQEVMEWLRSKIEE